MTTLILQQIFPTNEIKRVETDREYPDMYAHMEATFGFKNNTGTIVSSDGHTWYVSVGQDNGHMVIARARVSK